MLQTLGKLATICIALMSVQIVNAQPRAASVGVQIVERFVGYSEACVGTSCTARRRKRFVLPFSA